MNIAVVISPGELMDKITILEIKQRKIKDRKKSVFIKKELALLNISLRSLLEGNVKKKASLMKLKSSLRAVNLKLWNIENAIRQMERDKDFGPVFIKKAREVYITNDTRSEIKNRINMLFGSSVSVTEVKQYTKYK